MLKVQVRPIKPFQVTELRAKLTELRRRLPLAHNLGVSILEASGAWGALRREDMAIPRDRVEAVDVTAARLYSASESVTLDGSIADEQRQLLLSIVREPQNPESSRLAALHALGNVIQVPVCEIASLASQLDASDIHLHIGVLQILAEKGGGTGREAIGDLLNRYLSKMFDETKRHDLTNPQVFAAYLDHAENIVLVTASWYVLESAAFGGSPPVRDFSLWLAGDRRNMFGLEVMRAYARAAKRLGKQDSRYALDLLSRLKKIPLVRQDNTAFGTVLEAIGEIGGEVAWGMLMEEMPTFPFNQQLTGRRRYIRRLLGEPDKPEAPPPTAGPANRLNAFVLSSLATALSNFPRQRSLEILEAMGAWAFSYSKSPRQQLGGPRLRQTHDFTQTFKGASFVEEKVVRALTDVILSEYDRPGRDNQVIERAWIILAEMVAITVEVYSSTEAPPGGVRRLANKYVLAAYTDAIKALREIGKFGEGVDFIALQSMSSTYNREEIYRAAYRAMAVINPKEFLDFAEVRLQGKISDIEKIGIAYALGQALHSRDQLGTITASWNRELVKNCREILERLLGESRNSSLVHREAVIALSCFADPELETLLVSFLRHPQIPKPFDRPFTEEVLRLLAGFGGEQTLRLLTDLLENKVNLFGIDRLDINKLALDALALLGRRLQGRPMELRPYAPKTEPAKIA